ncbi:MAG TPA: protein phosphatase 2C domain-containing protein [Jatrophihabitans sp.]|nr:protein phosphatase 2C domain-containing protein [Jatrophihabitans sp.]
MALYLSYAVRSDLGLVRGNNEDSVYAGPRLLAIADGMGGHAAGEVASKIVIGTLEPLDEDRRIDDLMGALRDSVIEANQRIADAVKQRKELEGMGTTLTALRFVGSQVGLVHVGDSRAYLLRNDRLAQITHDDTYVQYLVDSGKLTPEEAKDHPRKSVILRALLGTDVEPDVSIREARDGDRYLLCSDGLSDVVSTETILETLRIEDPQEAADRLVELALRGGGPDNVTVIVADVRNARTGDRINDVPIVAGAFVDPAAADVPDSGGSPAERAKALVSKPEPAAAAPTPHRTRRSWRPWALVLGIVVLMLAALGGTYAWAQTQYFVGRADSDVAIYRGVNTEFGPLKFFTVYRVSDLRVDDLYPNVRSQIASGITAASESDAEKIVRNLHDHIMPFCPTTPVPTTTAPGSTPATSHTATSTAAASSASATRRVHATASSGKNRQTSAPPRRTATTAAGHAVSQSARATGQGVKPGTPTKSLGTIPASRHGSGTVGAGLPGSTKTAGSGSTPAPTSTNSTRTRPEPSPGAPCRTPR